MGFLFYPIWVWGSTWRPFRPPELCYKQLNCKIPLRPLNQSYYSTLGSWNVKGPSWVLVWFLLHVVYFFFFYFYPIHKWVYNNASNLECILFADDMYLFISQKDLDFLINTLNRELIKLSNLFTANRLSLNLTKTCLRKVVSYYKAYT